MEATLAPALPRSSEAGPVKPVPHLVITPKTGWQLVDWRELKAYRDLFYFLVWRDIKVRYAQSVLGVGWAVIQPVFSMIIFTIIFGRLAQVASDGVPYALFSFCALVPWTYFSNAVTESSSSLINSSQMITKVYFPRLVLPLTSVFAKLVDFSIALLLLFILMVAYKQPPTLGILALPLLIGLMSLAAAGIGMWLTALALQYRDVRYGLQFGVQLMMYASPIVYPVSLIPEKFQLLYSLNPMVGVVEGFRAALLGTRAMPWDMIGVGAASALVIAVGGTLYFRRMERIFADVA